MRQLFSCAFPVTAVIMILFGAGVSAQPSINDEELEGMEKRQAYNAGVDDARIEVINDLLDSPTTDDLYEWGNFYLDYDDMEGAALYHLLAVQQSPDYAPSLYKLALVYYKMEHDSLRDRYLKLAVEKGFWGYEVMPEDFEFLAETPEFKRLVDEAHGHYAERSKAYIGLFETSEPEGEAPETGRPVLVCLHGFGDDHISYRNVAELANGHGFTAVCIAGSVPRAPDSFAWSTQSIAQTHQYIQQILKQVAHDTPIDLSRVYLMGFSQGARHAGELAAVYPEQYLGATAYCPGPDVEQPAKGHPEMNNRPVEVWLGEQDPYLAIGEQAAGKWSGENPNVSVHRFEGEHHFPANWEDTLGATLDGLLKASSRGSDSEDTPVVLTDADDLKLYVGRVVTLRGEVSNTKVPEILGVEVRSDDPDLRGQMAEATGLLMSWTETQEEIDAFVREDGHVQSRGPGTFFRLKDIDSDYDAQVRPISR